MADYTSPTPLQRVLQDLAHIQDAEILQGWTVTKILQVSAFAFLALEVSG